MMRLERGLWVALAALWGCVPGGGSGGDDDARPGRADAASAADAIAGDAMATDAIATDAIATDAITDGGCVPDCTGRDCGDDGCGGACGACAEGALCDAAGACVTPPADCGDGTCGADEDCATCAADCGACCGDGRCARGEDCASCAADCACAAGRVCMAGACEPEGCTGEGCGSPPRILTFNANVRELTEGGAVVLSAVVTDPDGIADLIGGVLEDPSGAAYGAFVTAGEEGAYTLTLSWDALHAVAPIAFDGTARRTAVAVFFDQAGNRTTDTIELTLHCRAGGGAACDGRCVSLDSAAHCGACDAVCGDVCRDRACVCPDGQDRCDGVCRDLSVDGQHCGACGVVCPEVAGGETLCVDGDCTARCPGGLTPCVARCVDLRTDPADCGVCGRGCDVPANGAATCVAGVCGVRCDPGRTFCAGACAPCPVEGVAATTCDGAACVPRTCERDYRLCDGGCAACPTERVVETVCAGDRCVASRCQDGFHPCAEGCCPWRIVPVGAGRQRHALAVGEDGAHLAVGDGRAVRYGRFDGARWVLEEVVSLQNAPQGDPEVALAVDGETVHLVYAVLYPPPPGGSAPGVMRYLRREGGEWRDIGGVAGAGSSAPGAPSLALDGGVPWLAYDAGRVKLTSPDERFDVVDVTAMVGWDPDLAIVDGVMQLAWWYLGPRALGHAQGPVGVPLVESGPLIGAGFGLSPKVTVDRDGRPVILHRTDGQTLHVSRALADGRWDTVQLFPGIALTIAADLTTAPDGNLVGCISTPQVIYLLRHDGANWLRERIADGGASTCEVAFGPDGSLHLVFGRADGIDYVY